MNRFVATVALILVTAAVQAEDSDLRLGYALAYSWSELPASRIDPRFEDLPAWGHRSSFFAEGPLASGWWWSMSPGAANFEPATKTQFTYQYNLIAATYKTEGTWFVSGGMGIGGCIATLSTKDSRSEGVASSTLLRASALVWSLHGGVGVRWDSWEILAEVQGMGLFHDQLSRLDAGYFAVRLSRQIP